MSWKCSAHLTLCSDSVEMVLPSLFLTALVSLLLFPDIILVMSYTLFMFRCPAVFSASVARALKNSFLSFLVLFLTSLFSCQYVDVRTLFLACSLHRLISSLRHFLCVIRDQVSFDSHSFQLLTLLPKISSQDSPSPARFSQVTPSLLLRSSSANSRAENLFFTVQLNIFAVSLHFRLKVLYL